MRIFKSCTEHRIHIWDYNRFNEHHKNRGKRKTPNTLEKYLVYEISNNRLPMNDTYTDIHSQIFETLQEVNTR
jgi:hypothetical protein